ncbi:hypothetical protein OG379_06315 [Streptomyces sp. NBC_01166]|uniref:hypothetical protein n=1 Tax=Streptomyces sp. NBC_01166 TaxID=2903755 RepID=UPI00386B6243|nr:hypothetical protein OG379_06315 [Streptomyces sp. NBC_01166]
MISGEPGIEVLRNEGVIGRPRVGRGQRGDLLGPLGEGVSAHPELLRRQGLSANIRCLLPAARRAAEHVGTARPPQATSESVRAAVTAPGAVNRYGDRF